MEIPDNFPLGVWRTLSDEAKQAVLDYTNSVIQNINVSVSNVNQNVPVPTFNPKTMTADTYLSDLESYFTTQGIRKEIWLSTVGTLLYNEFKLWYNYKRKEIEDWAEFKREFRSQFDTAAHKTDRSVLLLTKVQKDNETVQSYVWAMMELARQVNPTEPVEDSVLRARDGLLPSIRKLIRSLPAWTPEKLIEEAKAVLKDITEENYSYETYVNY